VLTLTVSDRLHNYLVLSLLTGARTEELRALRWEHVHLDQVGSVPAHIEVWRSVREDGDTKTRKSRRTLALPGRCVDACGSSERCRRLSAWRVGLSGLEPLTSALSGQRSNRLSYRPARRGVPHGHKGQG
jgi:integrase